MGKYTCNYVGFFVPHGRESLVEKIVAALCSADGEMPFDFEKVIPTGSTRSNANRENNYRLNGQITPPETIELDGKSYPQSFYGFEAMGPATMIAYTFETKYAAPEDIVDQVSLICKDLGIGMVWMNEGEAEHFNPISMQYDARWEHTAEILPAEITETERAIDPERTISFERKCHA